jgi:peptidyl-prolyl cis-trans isomerase A (cyclophilin A)
MTSTVTVRYIPWTMLFRPTLLLCAALLGATACRSPEPSFRPRASAQDHAERPATPARNEAPPPAPSAAPSPTAPAAPPATPTTPDNPALLNPSAAHERAPAVFVAEFDTTKGPLRIEVHRDWSPNGADRFYNLVRIGYFTDVAFFRVIEGFMAQAGIHGRGDVNNAWRNANIPDDPAVQHNTRGMVSFAMAGPGTRTTQFFVNFVDNSRLDGMGFSPFGRVLDMGVMDRIYAGYGEGAPGGRGPQQARMQREGNTYLRSDFPQLDYIRSARIVPSGR